MLHVPARGPHLMLVDLIDRLVKHLAVPASKCEGLLHLFAMKVSIIF